VQTILTSAELAGFFSLQEVKCPATKYELFKDGSGTAFTSADPEYALF